MTTTQAKRQPRPVQHDVVEDDDELYNTRMPSSARRYRPSQPIQQEAMDELTTQTGILVQRRRSSLSPKNTNGVASNAIKPDKLDKLDKTGKLDKAVKTEPLPVLKRFPLASVIIGMVIMVVALMSVMALSSWWTTYQNDLHYGRPRTYQFDAVVGHNDSPTNPTHFILLNLRGHIEVMEMPGGDASHTRIYNGPVLYGSGQDLIPVTGDVSDVNHNGKPELILHIQGQQIVFTNDGTTFHLQQ